MSIIRSSFVGFLFLGVLLVALPLIVLFTQQQQQTQQHAATALPPQGLYESCAPSDGQKCLDRLDQMAKGGFKLVVNYDQFSGTKSQELAYAAKAQALGMKVIWGMSDPWWWDGTNLRSHYSDLAASCNCSDNKGFITYVVNLVKGLPATWGYYVGDEEGSQHTGVKQEGDLVKSIDATHPRLYISCANCDHDNGKTYVAGLAPMADVADVIGPDWYPVDNGDTVANTAEVAKETQALADKTGDKPTIVLQAFSWGEEGSHPGNWPTVAQMRQMRDLTLANETPPILLWYSFFNIMSSKDPTTHWNDLVTAAGANTAPISGTSPTAPQTPSQTPMPTPTNSPATPTPSISPDPTPTGSSGTTTLLLTLCPHGLGNCGDNANPSSGGNIHPLHTSRNVTLIISDTRNNQVAAQPGQVSYIFTSLNFQRTISVPNFSSGQYLVTVKIDGFLEKQIPGIVSVINGQTISLSAISVVNGDMNNDNQLDIQDYNVLLSCFGSKFTTSPCLAPATSQSPGADIDDDGLVNGVDYNLFLRELSVQKGR